MTVAKKNGITEGVIWVNIILFFIPIFLQSVLQQVFSITDAVIVGNVIGKEALGAINATSNLTRFFLNLFTGICSGATILIGQAYGGKKPDRVHKSLHTGMAFAIAGGLIMAAVCIPSTPLFMKIMSIPEDMVPYSARYTSIFFFGMIGTFIYDMAAGALRAMGDSKRPFYYLVISLASNIVLDLLFVVVLPWGITGAAAATAMAQFISAGIAFIHLTRMKDEARLEPKKIRFDGPTFREMIRLGVPMGISGVLYSISNIVIQSSVNSLGTDPLAGWSVHVKMDSVIWSFYDAVNVTAATFAAQNYGAGKMNRVREGVRDNFLVSGAAILATSAVIFVFARPIAQIFIQDETVVNYAVYVSRTMAPFYIFYLFGQVWGSTIRGCGETVRPMLIALIGTCGSRILWVVGVNLAGGPTVENMTLGYIVTWAVYSAMMGIYYYLGGWRKQAERTAAGSL